MTLCQCQCCSDEIRISSTSAATSVKLNFNSGRRQSVRLSVCPSACSSVCSSVCPSVRLSVRPSVHLSVCPAVPRSVCLSVSSFVRPSVRLLPSLSFILAADASHLNPQGCTRKADEPRDSADDSTKTTTLTESHHSSRLDNQDSAGNAASTP